MRRIFISSVAIGALVAGIASADAQRAMDNQGASPPPAAQQGSTGTGEPMQERRGSPAVREERRSPSAQRGERPSPRAAPRGETGTTTGQAPSRDPGQAERPDRPDRTAPARQADEPRSRPDQPTTGEAARERRQDGDQRGQAQQRERKDGERAADRQEGTSPSADRERTRTQTQDTDRRPAGERTGERRTQEPDRQQGRAGRDTGISLNAEQRTRVTTTFSERIEQRGIRPLRNVRFSVSVGTRLPRDVRLYDVPQSIVRVHPGFRGHRFVLVRDEIVIVEPRSYRIVAVLPRSGAVQARRGARETVGRADSRIQLRSQDRRLIRERVVRVQACHHELHLDFSIGIPLPRAVEVCEFPAEVIAEVPEIRSYRYVVRGDDVVIIDPDERRIVEVID